MANVDINEVSHTMRNYKGDPDSFAYCPRFTRSDLFRQTTIPEEHVDIEPPLYFSQSPSDLVFVRHGETTLNAWRSAERRGEPAPYPMDASRDHDPTFDPMLTPLGYAQARAAGELCARRFDHVDVIIASPFRRARLTALAIAEHFPQARRRIERGLAERNFGEVDGLSSQLKLQRYPSFSVSDRGIGKYFARPPGGENYPDVARRVIPVLRGLGQDYPGQSVVVICHEIVMRVLRRLLEGHGQSETLSFEIPNGALLHYKPRLAGNGVVSLQLHRFESASVSFSSMPS